MTWLVLLMSSTLTDLLAQVCDLGYTLTLHGPQFDRRPRDRWEARVTRPLSSEHGSLYAVGSYTASTPDLALAHALNLCATDFETHEFQLQSPTCTSAEFDPDLLSNLLSVPAMTLSPPKFKLKAPQ